MARNLNTAAHGPASTTVVGTVSTGAVTPAGQINKALSRTIQSTNFPEPDGVNEILALPTSRKDIDVAINNYIHLTSHGLSSQRPEIIALTSFEPAISDEGARAEQNVIQLPVFEALDIQLSAKRLRAENIIKLMAELKSNEATSPTIEKLEELLETSYFDVEKEIKFMHELFQKIKRTSGALTFKFNQQFVKDDMLRRSNVDDDPIRRLFVNKLGFTDEGYSSFTSTKIVLQLVDDLRHSIRTFSPRLTYEKDRRRPRDLDPYTIMRLDDVAVSTVGHFDVRSLSSTSSADIRKVLASSGMTEFQRSMDTFTTLDDKFKALVSILSRELKMSVGLSTPRVISSISSAYQLTQQQIDDNVFDHILGLAGPTIFDPVVGNDLSFIKLAQIVLDNSTTVLPFEKNIIRNGDKTMIPGHRFYVDSIIRGVQKFNVEPIKAYATSLSSATTGLANIIEGTLDIDIINQQSLGLNADDILKRLVRMIQPIIEELTTPNSKHDAFFVALLKTAADDVSLKHMLAIYIILVGVNDSQTPDGVKGFFDDMARAGAFSSGLSIAEGAIQPLEGASPHPTNSLTNAITDAVTRLQQTSFQQVVTSATGEQTTRSVNVAGSTPIDTLAKVIIQRVIDIVRISSTVPNETYTIESEQSIHQKLLTVGAEDGSFLLRSIVDFVNILHSLSKSSLPANRSYFMSQYPGLTKFNKLGMHTIVLMTVELFTTFFKLFPIVSFAGVKEQGSKEFYIRQDKTMISALKSTIQTVLSEHALSVNQNSSQAAADAFNAATSLPGHNEIVQRNVAKLTSINQKLKTEEIIVREMVSALIAIGNSVKTASDDLSAFFDPAGQNASVLEQLTESVDFSEKLTAIDDAQILLSLNSFNEQSVRRSSLHSSIFNTDAALNDTISPFIDDTVIDNNVKTALFELLASPMFRHPSAKNLSILSVAMPTGFFRTLQDRFESFMLGQNVSEVNRLNGLRTDVVAVNVYMKDLLFEDVVFKPKRVLFQLGRFVSLPDFSNVNSSGITGFERLAEQIITTKSTTLNMTEFEIKRLAEAFNDKSYDGVIDTAERNSLAKNHIISYLLNVYIRTLTGMNLTEDRFYLNKAINDMMLNDESLTLFQDLITNHVSAFAGRRITFSELIESNQGVRKLLSRISSDEILSPLTEQLKELFPEQSTATNVELSNDLITFMKTFTVDSILFGAGARGQKVVSPKLFERIFHIPVDPDDFEVDQVLTTSTVSGNAFMLSNVASRLLVGVDSRSIRRRDVSEGSLNDIRPLKFDNLVRREFGEVSLRQFFVSVEQLPRVSLPLDVQTSQLVPPTGTTNVDSINRDADAQIRNISSINKLTSRVL